MFVLILGSLVDSEDFFGQSSISLFQFRIRLGHEVVNLRIIESWAFSDLIPWMLRVWVTGLHVAAQISRGFSHETTLTAHEAATNVYKASLSFISVMIQDTLSSIFVILLELVERDALD